MKKPQVSLSTSCLEDVEELRSVFEKLAGKVNRLAKHEKGKKRAKVAGVCVDAVGDLVPFGIVADEVFDGGEDLSDVGGGVEISEESVGGGGGDEEVVAPDGERRGSVSSRRKRQRRR